VAQVIIFGNGQIAEVAHFYLTHDSPHEVVGFTVDAEYVGGGSFHDLPVVAFEEVARHFEPSRFQMFLPISYRGVNALRKARYLEAKGKGYTCISYVSSKATVWPGFVPGDNCFIFENNVIQPFVSIGSNVILWSGNHIGHHTSIADHCFLASHVVVSGSVTLGERCFVGVNATFRDGISIGEECVIGAGAVILADTEPRGVYLGAASERRRTPSDRLKRI
jgi:sugar O-acyltransferase (sialic acid O-acetyltransferase NeuD family)